MTNWSVSLIGPPAFIEIEDTAHFISDANGAYLAERYMKSFWLPDGECLPLASYTVYLKKPCGKELSYKVDVERVLRVKATQIGEDC